MANPERVEGSEDQWMCPFCKKKDFFELSQVWSHFDATDSCEYLYRKELPNAIIQMTDVPVRLRALN